MLFLSRELPIAEYEYSQTVSIGFSPLNLTNLVTEGFGYRWSPAIRWEDLVARRSFTVRCPHTDSNEAAFRFQAWVDTDVDANMRYVAWLTSMVLVTEGNFRKFPKLVLKLRAPIELENLLPYNLEYRIYDKDTDQNWRSYLRKGGVMPVHSVELGHMVLLNISVQDTGILHTTSQCIEY